MTRDVVSAMHNLVSQISGTRLPQPIPEFSKYLESTIELADHGECAIALENLCSNLHEFDFPISKTTLSDIQVLAKQLNISQKYTEPLIQHAT